MFCKHKWVILSEVITKSKFEVASTFCANRQLSTLTIPWQMADTPRKHIQILQCEKCGKLKRFVEEI
jgi:hypothetical protein